MIIQECVHVHVVYGYMEIVSKNFYVQELA